MVYQSLRVPHGAVKSYSEAESLAKEIGYLILIKVAAGGGGKRNENCGK